MHSLAGFVFLSAVMMARAGDTISEDLNVEPLSEVLYAFDVVSDASVSDLKSAIGDASIRHSFKVIGENRYSFVVHETDVERLCSLDFPDGSTVTQYPIEHVSDSFKMFNINQGLEIEDNEQALDDVILIMGETTFIIPEGTSTEEYSAMMERFARQYMPVHDKFKHVYYSVVASYPPKVFFIAQLEENVLQNMIKDSSDAIGGPGNRKTSFKHVVKV